MGALLGRASSRFVFVTLIPNLLFAAYLGALLAAGAPSRTPSLKRAIDEFHAASARDLIALLALIVVGAVALHPVQTPLIQILEGYWIGIPGGGWVSSILTRRYERLYFRLRAEHRAGSRDDLESWRRASAAGERLHWLPEDNADLLPTELGNTLRAGESRSAARYGFEVSVAIPRIVPLLPHEQQEQLGDRRNQLDAAARLCVVGLASVLVGIAILVPTGHWLYQPLIALAFSWVCYRASVAAAKGFCSELAVVVDLYHRRLWHALSLPAPPNLLEERALAPKVSAYLYGEDLDDETAKSIVWVDSLRGPRLDT